MNKVKKSSIAMYGMAGFGQNILYAMMVTYIVSFYTLELGGVVAGAVIFIARALDAFQDPFAGRMVDAYRTKFGKLRHYYLILPLPLAGLTMLLYIIPEAGLFWKAFYCLMVFFLWGCTYTFADLAFLGSSASMSKNEGERNKIISVSRILCTLGGALPTIIVPLILSSPRFVNDSTSAHIISATVFGIVGSAFFFLGFPAAKEVIIPPAQKVGVKDWISLVKQDKPLLLILCAGLLGSIRTIVQVIGVIVARVNFGSEDKFIPMAIAFGVALAIGTIITPPLVKKLGYKKSFIYSSLVGVLVQIIFWIVGYKSYVAVLIMLFLEGLPFGIYNTLMFTIPVDTLSYLEYKTGNRYEGVCFSLQTFQGKLAFGITGALGAALSEWAGYVKLAQGENYAPIVQDKLFLVVTLLPLIGCILCIIPMLFYKFDGKVRDDILAELALREDAKNLSKEKTVETNV